ncbi:hypothetical protein SAMN02745172_01766 [Pseudoxanthobacter soli DSM 19599]|uniref:Uncharacterized protein n=1 Tax=Pseudoxanthobacter soli DSM 19599 TaxID=1123029 RepID=A0A1M7ZI57_9HYPH|nr:hypothetical protein [Pseudoxanthobacter soli]SHO64600.1 hypothetical protein SAMN02745172_01766 [Pseudoxanthobacter soli DSM 19599]
MAVIGPLFARVGGRLAGRFAILPGHPVADHFLLLFFMDRNLEARCVRVNPIFDVRQVLRGIFREEFR